jgi:putative addiction module component (TIGR02574 family)
MNTLAQIEGAIRKLDPAEVNTLRDWINEYDPEPAEQGGQYLTDAQRAELRRRAAEDDANPDDTVPWEEVYSGILRRYGKS